MTPVAGRGCEIVINGVAFNHLLAAELVTPIPPPIGVMPYCV